MNFLDDFPDIQDRSTALVSIIEFRIMRKGIPFPCVLYDLIGEVHPLAYCRKTHSMEERPKPFRIIDDDLEFCHRRFDGPFPEPIVHPPPPSRMAVARSWGAACNSPMASMRFDLPDALGPIRTLSGCISIVSTALPKERKVP